MGKREMPAKEHRTQRRPQDSRKSQDNRRPRDSRRMQDSRKPQGNRRPEKSREELEEVYYNPAKSMAGDRRGSGTNKKSSGNRKETVRKGKKKDVLGLILAGLQGLVSVVFMVMLFILDMLPIEYLGIIAVILLLLFGITLATSSGRREGISEERSLAFSL